MARKQNRENNERTLRVIGGTWRGRKISFAKDKAIRPSPDRVRETLFNWLQSSIFGAKCLELYSGSGILSIEALSRGAEHTTIIDQSKDALETIKLNLGLLSAVHSRFSCVQGKASVWLETQTQAFDIIFLDPPFDSFELEQVLPLIKQNNLLAEQGYIYIESAQALDPSLMPKEWKVHRSKQAASVHYCLLTTAN
ncbi:MAG: 16S rRNA (guanine966-N2)-methyltransferase [Candidatus Azotimanducaceae bacterium]